MVDFASICVLCKGYQMRVNLWRANTYYIMCNMGKPTSNFAVFIETLMGVKYANCRMCLLGRDYSNDRCVSGCIADQCAVIYRNEYLVGNVCVILYWKINVYAITISGQNITTYTKRCTVVTISLYAVTNKRVCRKSNNVYFTAKQPKHNFSVNMLP